MSFDYEKQWIPCSERLPEEFKTVLCCTDLGEIFIAHVCIFADGYYLFDNENGMICEGNDVGMDATTRTV